MSSSYHWLKQQYVFKNWSWWTSASLYWLNRFFEISSRGIEDVCSCCWETEQKRWIYSFLWECSQLSKLFEAFWETFKLGFFLSAWHNRTLCHLKLINEAAASLNLPLSRDQGYKKSSFTSLLWSWGTLSTKTQSSDEQIIFQCAIIRWHESIYGHFSISVFSICSVYELPIQTQTLFRGTPSKVSWKWFVSVYTICALFCTPCSCYIWWLFQTQNAAKWWFLCTCLS